MSKAGVPCWCRIRLQARSRQCGAQGGSNLAWFGIENKQWEHRRETDPSTNYTHSDGTPCPCTPPTLTSLLARVHYPLSSHSVRVYTTHSHCTPCLCTPPTLTALLARVRDPCERLHALRHGLQVREGVRARRSLVRQLARCLHHLAQRLKQTLQCGCFGLLEGGKNAEIASGVGFKQSRALTVVGM